MGVTAEDLIRIDEISVPAGLVDAAKHSVRVDLAGTIVETRFDNLETAKTYRTRYRHMLSKQPAQRRAYAIAARPNEIYFGLEGGPAYRWDRFALKPHVIAFFADAVVTSGVFNSTDDLIALHAGVVCDERAAAAILGSTTAGKTTTSIACARRGLTLLSDEHCVVTKNGVLAFPRALNVRCGSIRLLAGESVTASPIDRWLATHRCCDGNDLGFDQLFGTLPRTAPKPLRAVFALVGTAPLPTLRRVSAAAMLEHAKSGAKMNRKGFEAMRALFTLLQSAESYELTLGTPDQTAQIIVRALGESGRERRSVA